LRESNADFFDTLFGNRISLFDSNMMLDGAVGAKAQRGDESEMRGLFGFLGRRGAGMRGYRI
jgi:hypothetical protein